MLDLLSECEVYGKMQHLSIVAHGVLVSCFCSLGCFGLFSVIQTPSAVMVQEGASVQINCCLAKNFSGEKVRWFQDKRTVQVNQTDKHKTTLTDRCSTLTITNTSKNDTGFYICEVTQDIPVLDKVKGTGTNVTYQEKYVGTTAVPAEGTSSPPVSHTLLLVCVSSGVGLTCICVCLSIWKLSRRCRRAERIVIKEGPPSEEEEPGNSEEEEHSSRNSRGSTQWYMVPVYESYFDLQRNDEQESAASEKRGSAASENTGSAASEKSTLATSGKRRQAASEKRRSAASEKRRLNTSKKKKTGSL